MLRVSQVNPTKVNRLITQIYRELIVITDSGIFVNAGHIKFLYSHRKHIA